MDDYDPACPTEDDPPFEEIDLSQVPLPPMLPLQGEAHAGSLPPELEKEEKRTGKKKKRKRNEDRSQPEEAEDKEDDETSDHCPILESAEPVFNEDIDDIPVLVPAVATDSDDNAKVDLTERDPPVLIKPEPAVAVPSSTALPLSSAVPSSSAVPPSSAVPSSSAVTPSSAVPSSAVPSSSAVPPSSAAPSAMTLSTPTTPLGKLHFKLTPDPNSGKAKVSFQLKKSVKSTFHAAEDDEEEERVVEEEEKDIVEKTAAGEYIPTRFKVSKKHEIFRPSLDVPSLNIAFPSTVISSGGASSTSSASAQVAKAGTQAHEVSGDSRLTVTDDASEVKGTKMKEGTHLGRETRYRRREEDSKATEKSRGLVDSPRELRRSERRDKNKEDSNIDKNEGFSRSTRRISRGGDRDVERHGSLRSSYSRREQNEGKYKEEDDKSRKAEPIETNEKRRSSRSKRSDSDMRREEKRSTDRRHDDDDNDSSGKRHNHERSPRREKNASPSMTEGRRTRSSHRNRSLSKERDSKIQPPSDLLKPHLAKDAASKEMAADRLTGESQLDNENCDTVIQTASGAVNTGDPPLLETSSKVVEETKTGTDESAEKHPQIQKIVIRRSLESNDFEIAMDDLGENLRSEDSHTNLKTMTVCKTNPAKDSFSSASDKEVSDSLERGKYTNQEDMEECDTKDTTEPLAQQKHIETEKHKADSDSPKVEFDGMVKDDKKLVVQESPDKRVFGSQAEEIHQESSQMDKFHGLSDTGSDNAESEKVLDSVVEVAESQELVGRSRHVAEPETSLLVPESDLSAASTACAVEVHMLPDDGSQIVESQMMVESQVVNVTSSANMHEVSSHIAEAEQLVKQSMCIGELPQLPERSSLIEESQRLSEKSALIEESQKLPNRSKCVGESEKLPAKSTCFEELDKLPARSKFTEESEKLPARSKLTEESEKLPARSKHVEESEKLPARSKLTEESEKLPARSKLTEESEKLPARSKLTEESEKLPARSKLTEESEKLPARSKLTEESEKLPARSKHIEESEKFPARSKHIEESEKLPASRHEKSEKLPERNYRVCKSQKLPERKSRTGESPDINSYAAESREFSERSLYSSESRKLQRKSLRATDQRNSSRKSSASPESRRFRDKRSFTAESEKVHRKNSPNDGAQKLSGSRSYASERALLPEQVLVDVSALPGKSRWEMDEDDDMAGDRVSVIEEKQFVKDPIDTHKDSISRHSQRSRKVTESSSNEDDISLDHKRHKDKKKDKAEKKLKKKRKHERSRYSDNVESAKATEDTDVNTGKEESSRRRPPFDNSKIVNYLKEYSKKEEKTSKAKTEIDSVKLVAYLKEYSGKMVTESSLHDASDSEGGTAAIDDKPQKRKTKDDLSTSNSSRAAEEDQSEGADVPQGDSASGKQKEQSNSDPTGLLSDCAAKMKKREAEESEQRGGKDESDLVSVCSRSSSHESSKKKKDRKWQLRKKDERSTSSKEKRGRSSSSDRSEVSTSKFSQRSRDRRDRPESLERSRKSQRHRSRSTDRQDDRRQIRRRSRSRSPSWRSRDRRNRSRSKSQDRRGDRRNRSRSRDRNYSYRLYRSPGQESHSRTRRDKRDKRGRSRSDSHERSSTRRRRSREGSLSKPSKYHKKSKSPDKKGKETSSGAKFDADRKSDTELKVMSEVSLPANVSSIPIPDEIPMPRDETKKSILDREEQDMKITKEIGTKDKLQGESMKLSNKEKDTDEMKSIATDTKDAEMSMKTSVPEQTEAVKTRTVSKTENTDMSVNPATLACGKDRQIKFSILGASKKVQSVLISGMIIDDDDDEEEEDGGGGGNEEHLGKETSVIIDDGALREREKSGSATKSMDRKPTEQDNSAIPSVELSDEPQTAGKIDKVSRSSPADIDDVNDFKSLDNEENDNTDESLESPHKVSASSEKETPVTTSSPKRLKFKYIPLWEMEETERRPVFEEVSKKVEQSLGLALGYGSGSSDDEDDDDSNTKQEAKIMPEEACPVKKLEEDEKSDVRSDKSPFKKLKEDEKSDDVRSGKSPVKKLKEDEKSDDVRSGESPVKKLKEDEKSDVRSDKSPVKKLKEDEKSDVRSGKIPVKKLKEDEKSDVRSDKSLVKKLKEDDKSDVRSDKTPVKKLKEDEKLDVRSDKSPVKKLKEDETSDVRSDKSPVKKLKEDEKSDVRSDKSPIKKLKENEWSDVRSDKSPIEKLKEDEKSDFGSSSNPVKKLKEDEQSDVRSDKRPVKKLKDEKSDVRSDIDQNASQKYTKLEGTAEDSTQDARMQTSSESDTKAHVTDQFSIQHKTQLETEEECMDSESTKLHSENLDIAEVFSETDKEAYSPSHPSMEDTDVIDDVTDAGTTDSKDLTTSVVDSKPVSKVNKASVSATLSDMERVPPALPVSDSVLSNVSATSCSLPATSVVTSALTDITSINIASIPLPGILPPAPHILHIPQPVNPPGGAVPPANMLPSVMRQPFSGLRMPLAHSSQLAPPLPVPRPVPPPAPHPVPPPAAVSEMQFTNLPLSMSAAPRPVPPPAGPLPAAPLPRQQTAGPPPSALAFGVPGLLASPQVPSPGQPSRGIAAMLGAASVSGVGYQVPDIRGRFQGVPMSDMMDMAPAPQTNLSSVQPVPPPAVRAVSVGLPPVGGTIPSAGALTGRTLPVGTMPPIGTLPGRTLPVGTMPPIGTLPGRTLPVGTVPPIGTLPGRTLPVGTVPPIGTLPSRTLPFGTVPPIGTIPGGLLPSAGAAPTGFPGVVTAGALPSTSTLSVTEVSQRNTLPSVCSDSQTATPLLVTTDSPANVLRQLPAVSVDSMASGTPPMKFRINRFHQSPPVTQIIPPPSIAIPLPTLAFPSTLASSITATSTVASVPFIPPPPSVQQSISANIVSASGDTKLLTPPIPLQKPAIERLETTTAHSKRPKISSILSHPKIDDLVVLPSGAKMTPSEPAQLASVVDKSNSAQSTDLPVKASVSSGKQPPRADDGTVGKPETDISTSVDRHIHKSDKDEHVTRSEKPNGSDSAVKGYSDELVRLPAQSSGRDVHTSQTVVSPSLHVASQEGVLFSTHLKVRECIPLPGEVTSSVDSHVSLVVSPQPSQKSAPPRPPSSPPMPPPPPPSVPEPDSPVTSEASSKGQTVSSSQSDRKKRFSQSPLAIGMLPKVSITQSPLAAGPLPKLPPEPEENNNASVLVKRKVSSPLATDAKPTMLNQAAKQKKLPLEKVESKSTSKVHFVFKSKSIVQKTLISAFDDEESDGDELEATSEAAHAEKSLPLLPLTPALAADKKGTPNSSSASPAASTVAVADTEKQTAEKDRATTESAPGKEHKSKVVSLTDIEAFPVQVITSSRKEEDTPAASWPEFTVAKKRKDEESGGEGKRRSHDRDDRKKSKRYSHEREREEDQEHRKKRSKYGKEEDKKHSSRKRGGSRSDDEHNNDYDSGIKIKKEKEDNYEDSWPAGQNNKSSDQKKGNLYDADDDRRKGRDKESSSYSKRKNRYDDNESDYKKKNRDNKEDKYSRRRNDKDDDHTRRRYDESRRPRHSEGGRSRDRSHERDKSDRNSSKSSGKRHHKSRDESHSRSRSKSPSRKAGRSREHSRDTYDRQRDRNRSQSRSRSHSHERGSSSSSRRKDSKTFKEELLEELTKPSTKADPKDDLFKVAAIVTSNQSYVPEYPADATYSSVSDANLYSMPHHTQDLSAAYPGQDFHFTAHYPPSYEHQEFTSHWQGQPPHPTYNQLIPLQHQEIPGQYPPIPPEQVPASHPYPFQTQHHFPPPNYPNNQILTDPYHPVPSILQPQLPQMQHPVSGPPPPTHIHIGHPMPPHYPPVQTQVPPPPYTLSGPPINFQPHIFTQETRPPVTSSDFLVHPGPRPRPPLLPTPVISPLLRAPLVPQNKVETSSFSSPDVVSSPGLHIQPEHKPPRKSRFSPLEEGTFSPGVKGSLAAAAASSPTVGSPSTTSMVQSDTTYTKSAVSASNEQSSLPEPSFETSLLAESEFDLVDIREAKRSSQTSSSKKKSSLEVNEPIVSSSGVEDSTGDTGSDSGTDSSSQKPQKVKSRWRSNSEADAVVVTSKPLSSLAKQILDHGSAPRDVSDFSSYERCTRSRTAAVASTAELDYANIPLLETSSPTSPSRKRAKTQSDIADMSQKENDDAVSPEDESKGIEDEAEEDLASIVARPDFPKFEIITENIHLTERKRSKSMKRMVCDCTTSREDRSKGIPACGSDCLNRMLMIECGSRCPCGDYCTNKRFQKKQYSRTVPFKAGDKGWGLRAQEDMEERGTFIMEYVGELLDYEEFVRRTRQYSKAGLIHHYFMALNADEVVDATLRGSISRFINHSCDPNCETQKWTVNGELRVGFFTRKVIKKGEELTFDYQFEHYGEAQKCYCGSDNCRGYIGLVKSPTRNNRKKEKKKKEIFKDELLEEEIEELSMLDGMRNKNHVLDLCRLMVRAEKVQHRMAILRILQDTTESACLRLFLDYHGLPLLWSWMADIGTADYSAQTQELKLLMLSVLKSLPVTNKTALKESKIPDVVERWAVAAVVAARKPPPPPPPATTATALAPVSTKAADSIANTTMLTDNEAVAVPAPVTSIYEAASVVEDAVEDAEKAAAVDPEATTSTESSPPESPPPLLPSLNTITPVSILASAKDSKDAKRKRRVTFAEMHEESTFSPEPHEDMDEDDDISSSTQAGLDTEGKAAGRLLRRNLKSDESLSSDVADSTSSSGTASDTDNSDTEALIKDPLASLAAECISLWSSLKEVFKIPKKERVEERKRTERELDVLSKKDPETSDPFAKWKRSKVMRLSRKKALEDDDRKSSAPKMSKEERRQLFEAQVKKEDEMAAQAYAEEYQRQQEEYVLHQQRLLEDPQYFYFHQQQQGDPNFAGLNPSLIPPEGLQDPVTGQPIPNEILVDPNTGQPAIDPNMGQPIIDHSIGQNIGQALMHHPPHIDPNIGQHVLHQLHIDPQTGQPVQHIDPLAGQFVQHIDPLTGQPVHQIDPLTGQPISAQIDPMTGQLLQHQMEPLMSHPNLQHPQFDPSVEPPRPHQHPVLGQTPTPNFQQQPPAQHLPTPPQNTNLLEIDFEEEVPPPPSPPTVPVTKLPPNWKTAKDAEGRVYYYHAFTRQTQWEMPSWEDDDDSDDMELDPIPMEEVIKGKKKTTTAAADTSSEVARKIKDQFRSKMSNFIVTYLNPYRKQDCKIGRIVSTDDFKHLARKLTHHVMSKELKHCRHVEDLEVNENVKAKAKDYVRKYMSKFGTTFRKTSSPNLDDPTT